LRRIVDDRRAMAEEGDDRGRSRSPELARIITTDPHLEQIIATLPLYAGCDLPVLVTGEPGTGKELLVEALGALSPRRHRPFHRLNCAALTDSLACSELFGHLRGSFTDAHQSRAGKFKSAHLGTLFLDELGELPLAVQPRLLRAVEEGEIEPVGGDVPLKVDVRLLAATNQDLPRLIAQGRFRQDLYDRLAVLMITLPPLRERGEDTLLLARHFLKKVSQHYQRSLAGFTAGAMRRLNKYSWPGNVRELRNVVTRAVLLSPGPRIREGDLFFTPSQPAAVLPSFTCPEARGRPDRGRLEGLILEEGGNICALARRLGVASKTIYRWLRFHGLDLVDLRGSAAMSPGERGGGPGTFFVSDPCPPPTPPSQPAYRS